MIFAGQTSLEVEQGTISQAIDQVPQQLKQAIELAVKNVTAFHLSQREEVRKVETSPGVTLLERISPHRTSGYLHTGWNRSPLLYRGDAGGTG